MQNNKKTKRKETQTPNKFPLAKGLTVFRMLPNSLNFGTGYTFNFLAGLAVAAAGRCSIRAWQAFKARPPRVRRFYEGGFQATMNRREAALMFSQTWMKGSIALFDLFTRPSSCISAIILSHAAPKFDNGRDQTPTDKIKEAHKRVMVANHPDAGGKHYLASKINEAKEVMLGKTKGGGGSAF
ncbi:hypothetical protein PIB30_029015 [Stylosanthes scabra]|uniref:Mitochondrial import inner membrane translocase subunit TIM14 n=1 Tax=Stylosanthes scabra TaxID=79078 RepID=A0ABU6YBD8_9FABA|nr:hypothetical protein [Stylosanthes scabra]